MPTSFPMSNPWVHNENVDEVKLEARVTTPINDLAASVSGVSGLVIQSGTDTVSLSSAITGTKAITFPTAFATAPNVIVGSQFTTSGAVDFVAGVDHTTGNPTTTGFTVRVMSTTKATITNTCRIYWIAVGT